MSSTPTTPTATPTEVADADADGQTDWEIAGAAWAHAAVDWAYRFEPYARDAIAHCFAATGVGPERRLLDLACGSGYALGVAERAGAPAAGIDASAGLIEIAATRPVSRAGGRHDVRAAVGR